MRFALRLALLFSTALAACDAVPPAPPDPPDPVRPTVAVVRPLADTVVFLGSPRWVPLEERFRHSGAAALAYSARSDGDAVAVHVSEYDYLVLEPLALGTATVTVEARAEDGASAADTLSVEVLPACPPDPEPGALDYFPLEAGRTWHFLGTRTDTYPLYTLSETVTSSLTVLDAVCRAGERRYTLRVEVDDATYSFTRDYDLTEHYDHTLALQPTLQYPATLARYAGPAAPDTLDGRPFMNPLAGSLCPMYSNEPDTVEASLTAGVGPTVLWRQGPISHTNYGVGVRTCRVVLAP
jgi:hypothetical protein